MDIERDPSINKLQSDVFAKMAEISKPEPGEKKPLQSDIKTISPEEALKELLDLEKNQTDSNT
jgi:hypothetical protein